MSRDGLPFRAHCQPPERSPSSLYRSVVSCFSIQRTSRQYPYLVSACAAAISMIESSASRGRIFPNLAVQAAFGNFEDTFLMNEPEIPRVTLPSPR